MGSTFFYCSITFFARITTMVSRSRNSQRHNPFNHSQQPPLPVNCPHQQPFLIKKMSHTLVEIVYLL